MTIGIAKTEEEDQERNDWGLPNVPLAVIEVTAAPSSPQTTRIDQKIDNSKGKNEALPWLVMISLMAGGSFVGSIVTALYAHTEVVRVLGDNDIQRRRVEELRIRVEDNESLIQDAGIKKPGDAITGPAANPKRLKP